MRQPPSAVIFDWGGVFACRPAGSTRRSLERQLELEPGGLGAFFREDDWLRLSTGLLAEAEFWRRVCAGFPKPPDEALSRRVWGHLFGDAPRRLAVIEIVRALRGTVRLGLLSNAGPGLRQAITPLLPLFDDVVISAEVGCRKPDPEIFQLALLRLGVRAEEAFFIDDFAHNVAAARELGLRAHRFRTPGRLIEALARRGLQMENGVFKLPTTPAETN